MRIVKLIAPSFIVALVISSLMSLPGACGQQTQDTIKTDASGCVKSISLSTYLSVISAAIAAAQDKPNALSDLGVQIGESLVVCAAKDLVAIFEAKSSAGSGSGRATSQPEPVVISLKSYLATKGVK